MSLYCFGAGSLGESDPKTKSIIDHRSGVEDGAYSSSEGRDATSSHEG